MITGESRPVRKEAGAKVIAGTINGDGSLRVRVTATGDQTALAGIMRLVEQAQQSKSQTQVLADRAAGWLFYIALAVAALGHRLVLAIDFNAEVLCAWSPSRDRLSARPRPGCPTRGCHHDRHGRQERDPGA
jgi:Cu2+-exporting ATPase